MCHFRTHALQQIATMFDAPVEELSTAPITDCSLSSDYAARWSFRMYRLDVAYLFERRQVAGAVPNAFLKARENAASELYPTNSATCAREPRVLRSFWVATCMRQLAT